MAYPASIDSFTAKTDGVDNVMAADVNKLHTAIVAVETELGADPAGTAATVVARLNNSLSGAGMLQFAAATTLTIASGAVTATQNYHRLDTEGAVSTDDLDTITAMTEGHVLFLTTVSGARDVTLKHGTGNIQCAQAKDIVLGDPFDVAVLIYDDTVNYWLASSGAQWLSKAGGAIGGASNFSEFEADGTLVFHGDATVFDDLRIEPVSKSIGLKAPTFGTFRNGLLAYEFDDALVAAEKELFFSVQIPHAWKEGSNVSPHVHFAPLVAGSAGNLVRWGLEYSKAKIGTAFGASTTIYASTLAYGTITTQYSHCLVEFADIDMTGDTLSTILVCRLFRNSSHADDTLAQTVGLLYIDFHYEIDTIGSRAEFTK